ncbi:hypothetical protein SAMN03159341_102244 [Paenibacillus sp. 1_12]|uniref:hypothetical protein n=1 Tax=Paenibacillus sp. 1_12 TaxID=1566278 RepID=UPI0008E397AA|nr:hypothetical protein [Paenibacillus sp. 1_12]SFK93473.1 hypothetical protein SAMN03159341_102244 [Paenibacillus sp. 1_12]
MDKHERIFIGILISIALICWCPWMTNTFAQFRAIGSFQASQKGILDGCGVNCKGCGVIDTKKVLFGYSVTVEYACGLLPKDSPEYHKSTEKFVSFIGTVH